ncbi:MAG: tRNA(Ile)-lysidine synthetase [Anaerolineaceae bacterium]
MRCRKCGQKAVINLHQHRLSLCRAHYLEWIPEQTLMQMKKFNMFRSGEKILVAVSGGKDSLALWDILQTLGIQADGLFIHLGITGPGDYSGSSGLLTEQFALARNLTLHIVNVEKDYGKSIPRIIERNSYSSRKPCADCGLVKRSIMNRFALDNEYDCIATGHNLDDEAAVLFSNTMTWSTEKISRQYPVLAASGGMVRKVKPLNHFYERETTAYTLLRGIQYIQEECPFSGGNLTNANKEFLNQLENDRPGAKMTFYTSFLKAQKDGFFHSSAGRGAPALVLAPCPKCGQPTTTGGLCSFCKLFSR